MIYDLTLRGPETRALFDLRGDPAATFLPPPALPNRRTTAGAVSLIAVGPARWLVMAPLVQEATLEAQLRTATLVSDTLAFFILTGADAARALAIACPIDLHPRAFPADAASFTDAFGTRALVLREGSAWVLAVEPSYADYIADHLRRIV